MVRETSQWEREEMEKVVSESNKLLSDQQIDRSSNMSQFRRQKFGSAG